MTEQKLCTVCGTIGLTKRNVKGSLLTELFLWCFFLIPGLIYSIWRHSTVSQVCGICGSPAVIPMNSPVAQQILANRGNGGQQIPAPAAHYRARGAVARRAPRGKIALGIVGGCFLLIVLSGIAINKGAPAGAASQNTLGSSAPAPQASKPVASKAGKRTQHTGNVAQDLLVTYTAREQALFLGKAVGEGCIGTRAFFMGMDPEKDAMWSVGCTNGQSYSVEIHPDPNGTTQVLECSVLKALAGTSCFTKFTN